MIDAGRGPAFAAAVNKGLMAMDANGEFDKIWNRWLGPDTRYGITRSDKIAPMSELKFQPMPCAPMLSLCVVCCLT